MKIWIDGANIAPQRLSAGKFLTISERDPTAVKAVQANPTSGHHWRESKVGLAGRSFAIAEFNRCHERKMILADATRGNERLAGIFHVNDPVQIAMALGDGIDIDIDLAGNSDIILNCCQPGSGALVTH